MASDRAGSTKVLYAGLTRNYVDPQIGSIPLDRLRPADVTRMLLGMEKVGMSGSTRRSAYAALPTRWTASCWRPIRSRR
jgi:integrase